MNGKNLILAACTFSIFAGCATPPDNTSDVAVRVGMSRTELTVMYGEPLRIEPNASGGEDWYYHFYSRYKVPNVSGTVSSETDFHGNTVSSTSESVQLGQDTDEQPIHLSRAGNVVEPLPSGKVLKN
jgi:outer membrane protein assembly factor BamE (lipoprotein component of BamABCDE complex)